MSKYTNITTKLKWKLFTKVIKRPSKEAQVQIDRVFNVTKKLCVEWEKIECTNVTKKQVGR